MEQGEEVKDELDWRRQQLEAQNNALRETEAIQIVSDSNLKKIDDAEKA
jgi:hypothetical protein